MSQSSAPLAPQVCPPPLFRPKLCHWLYKMCIFIFYTAIVKEVPHWVTWIYFIFVSHVDSWWPCLYCVVCVSVSINLIQYTCCDSWMCLTCRSAVFVNCSAEDSPMKRQVFCWSDFKETNRRRLTSWCTVGFFKSPFIACCSLAFFHDFIVWMRTVNCRTELNC